ncbi:DUF3592 domain-containing protein [Kitasatospora kifunensis]|uniref:DUF3592 domain-containing protein n=1 Tax=Kitasatospora kifunensis TaxID=58351 RepID=A0A7W7R6D9_KITKI|nr:DUF3592 domain-containing protein [Kitasatospora kifunensis]MBB4925973.1 hypothetical protein [Kitasatospora kifunensis]
MGVRERIVVNHPGPVLGLLLLVGGGLTIGFGIRAIEDRSPYPGGLSATGRVVEVVDRSDGDSQDYVARYEFTTADGHRVTITDPGGSSHRPAIGSSVGLSYRAGDPQDAHVVSGRSNGPMWLLFGLGGLFALIGLDGALVRPLRRVLRRTRR